MSVKQIAGTHLTAFDKKMIGQLVDAYKKNNEHTFGKTPKKTFKILSATENRYDVRIQWNETNDWGKVVVQTQKVTVEVE